MDTRQHKKIFDAFAKDDWFTGNINLEAVTDAPICSFYCYLPLQNHMVSAHISMDKFYELVERSTVVIPSHARTTTNMIDGILLHSLNTFKKHSPEDEEAAGMFMAMYMPLTGSGSKFLTHYPDVTFDFVVVLYPTNKKGTNYAGRPAVYPRTDSKLLNVEEALDRAEGVMKHDLNAGKKEYFKYLKGWKKKHN